MGGSTCDGWGTNGLKEREESEEGEVWTRG